MAPVGRDTFGEEVVAATRAAGVVVDHLIPVDDATGTYLAVLDTEGELVVAVSNMRATDRLTVRQLMGSRDLLSHATLLVLDGNIPEAPAAWLLDFAAAVEVPVVIDPVSVAKARPLSHLLSPQRPVLAPADWPRFAERLEELGARLEEAGLKLAYHHHMGTVVQTEDEVDRLMDACDDSVGLLLDTGHFTFDERTADVDSVMQSIIDAREEAIIRQQGREAARED